MEPSPAPWHYAEHIYGLRHFLLDRACARTGSSSDDGVNAARIPNTDASASASALVAASLKPFLVDILMRGGRRRGPRGQLVTFCGDHYAPLSENLSKRRWILVLRRSKFAHVNECRIFRIKYGKFEAGVVVEIPYFASQRLERPHGLALDVVHGKSTHGQPQSCGAYGYHDPTVRSKPRLRNHRRASR